MQTIIEYVTFETDPKHSNEAVKQAIYQTDAILAQLDGFIKRDLAQRADATWVEVVYWRDMKSAEEGLATFIKDTRSAELFAMIIQSSVKIDYSNQF
ncbi:MAG: hypothetical protein V7784_02445 [Oceanospirillaceae bacterium]